MVLNEGGELVGVGGRSPARVSALLAQDPDQAPAIPLPTATSRKADLRQAAIRWYAGLRFHARNCTDCTPGTTDTDPPRINRLCWPGKAIKADYERAYRAWVECPEGKGS